MDYLSITFTITLLSRCLNLESGVLSIHNSHESLPDVNVSLITLKHLHLRFFGQIFDEEDICSLEMLNGLQFPALHTLQLYPDEIFSWTQPAHLHH